MSDAIRFHDLSTLSAAGRHALLARTEADLGPFLDAVRPIVAAVRAEGDEAVARFTRDFDKAPVSADGLRVGQAALDAAPGLLEPEVMAAIDFAADSIRRFHEAQLPEEMWWKEVRPGVFAGDRIRPIPSVACYVPRGKGAFPSVAMMTTIPALAAKVPTIVIITPPGPDGQVDTATLAVAKRVGVTQVFAAGGAQGVAAVAYGTATIPKCDKIVGPGSPYVVAAKRLLADAIDTGTPAGPSESIILADDSVDGALAALDLIIESEHGPDSSAYLVTDSRRVAEQAAAALPGHWAEMSAGRAGFSRTVLTGPRGGIVLAPDWDSAIGFVNDYAPEHLQILSRDPFADAARIDHAGEILLGPYTPVTIGNFVLGPNAVLPTGGHARTASPLSVFDFLKRTSIGYVSAAGYPALAEQARTLATYEGFDGHARAVSEVRDRLLKRG
ncbi:histidinol dehydrogenase [Inquilinus sp. CA228]|uniref:histidinol dehydrogenase n=1 Tax=Inquilinus sp. CA228 TaxID=3455609 RepID=UPI003F8D222A